ncbi:DNA topoisomerase IV subunit A [Clostridioides difficile]|nr:DNA topoisomerase IV subunit A [Clostridioides difficile]
MGKVASGVTGISLREEDEVIFGAYVSKYLEVNGNTVIISPRSQEISLTSKANEKVNITVEDIKLQNRAGRGTNVMLMIDDELKDVMIV